MEQNEIPLTGHKQLRPGWMAAGAVFLVVVIALVAALYGEPAMSPQVGEPVPEFQLISFDGTPMILATQRGKVVVLNFFASWCSPCRQEATDLEQVWRDYGPDEVQFYGVGYKDAAANVKRFLVEFDVTYPATAETSNATARAYGVTGAPETFVIDQAGLLVRHYLGPIGRAELAHELGQLLDR
ncbi:MAG TPA: TlpA disulfide reductase family protein [Anaerolineae bacterium]|nr:TlpA disulfide reductase family protein [Anaerolineae bacterium]